MLFRKKPTVEPPILHARDDDFEEAVAAPGVTVVDFWAPWCAPCRMMESILGEIALEWAERGVRVLKVNVDEAPRLAHDFEVRSIPTTIFFRDGQPLFEVVGLISKPVFERELGELVESR